MKFIRALSYSAGMRHKYRSNDVLSEVLLVDNGESTSTEGRETQSDADRMVGR